MIIDDIIMSRTKIKREVRRDLWFNAHGRCEICNKPLYRDGLTMLDVNLSEYAHIIADSSKGPRGDNLLSSQLANSPDNLILLCKDHHKLIDDAGGVNRFGVDLLRDYKRKHEERIDLVTNISPEKSSLVVCYAPTIGDNVPSITTSEIIDTLFPEMYPMTHEPIRLAPTNIPYDDSQKKYWEVQSDILIENYRQKLKDKIVHAPHISLFAIAPQPLLVLLGTLISDIYKVEIWQKHREPKTWKWLKEGVKNDFQVHYPENINMDPVLIFALSGSDIVDRVKKQLGDCFSIWVVTCENPNRDMMKTRAQLMDFGKIMRELINEINSSSVGKEIKIFSAMPQSCAIMLGHMRLPKADNPWVLYDLPKGSDEYIKTITI